MANYAVFDIGGTAIKCAVTDGGGCIREKERLVNPARTDGVGAMLALLIQRLRAYEAAYPLTGSAWRRQGWWMRLRGRSLATP